MLDPFELSMQSASKQMAQEFSNPQPKAPRTKKADKPAAVITPAAPAVTQAPPPVIAQEAPAPESDTKAAQIIPDEPEQEPFSSECITPPTEKEEPAPAPQPQAEIPAAAEPVAAEPVKKSRSIGKRFIGSLLALLSLPGSLTISGGFLLSLLSIILAASSLKKSRKGGFLLTVGIIGMLASIAVGVLSVSVISNETFDAAASQVWNTMRYDGLPAFVFSIVDFLEKLQLVTTDFIRDTVSLIQSAI